MGRPSKPLIDKALVIEAALSLIDEQGVEGLSMRDLGTRLGVNPASLYHHFQNKEEILEIVRQHVIAKVKLPPRMHLKPWEDQILILGKAYRTALNDHPNAAWLVSASNPTRIRRMTHHHREGLIATLLTAGFTGAQAVLILVGVETLVSGNVIEELCMGPRVEFGKVDQETFPKLYEVALSKPLILKKALPDLLQVFIAGVKTLLPAVEPKPAPRRLQAAALRSTKPRR